MALLAPPIPSIQPAAVDQVFERPLRVESGGPAFDDGRVFGFRDLGAAGWFVYRLRSASIPPEVWDEEALQWRAGADPLRDRLRPSPLIYDERTARWRGMLVAAGPTDGAGMPRFSVGTGGFPAYFVRTLFAAAEPASPGAVLSVPSLSFRFRSLLDLNRAGLAAGVNETLENASEIQMFLRGSAGLQVAGSVRIRNVGGLAEVEISNLNAGGAVIRLLPSGDIELRPAPGRSTLLGTVRYQPADPLGNPYGPVRWLP